MNGGSSDALTKVCRVEKFNALQFFVTPAFSIAGARTHTHSNSDTDAHIPAVESFISPVLFLVGKVAIVKWKSLTLFFRL